MPTEVGRPDVGRHVRDAREATGLSLRALARTLDVSPATLSELETGKTRMTVERLHRIAATLGRSVEDLLSADRPAPAVGRTAPEGDWRGYGPLHLDAVLDAALTVFLRTGYHGASVRDVAAGSGLSVAGIYHHHASKQVMLQRILDRGMDDLLWRCRAAVGHGGDEVERFRLLVETMALFHTHRREIGFLAASEMRSLDPEARADMTARRTVQQRLVDAEVLAGVDSGRMGTPHAREASRAVVTMCKSIAEWYRPDGPFTPEDVAERYVRFASGIVGIIDP
ncbi:TetR family transcriptional regulator [Pseudonocardia sediminis]|uniref:TetR family transcriptional regulator n=1 Tax=Pseudonocardia sediminis TaxID=1397368 RepID=A0A4Q7UXU5_PSEST|nr:TetR family transcriptional regulator [Pseudonocardia sediminis]RZT86907.1 TetR family transcriptional regulator [Pseudonocardia sediminis]